MYVCTIDGQLFSSSILQLFYLFIYFGMHLPKADILKWLCRPGQLYLMLFTQNLAVLPVANNEIIKVRCYLRCHNTPVPCHSEW